MKTSTLISRIVFLVPLLCVLPLCRGDEPSPNDPLRKMKNALVDDEAPSGIVKKTTDANRSDVVAKLKQILSESLANPTAPQSARYAAGAIMAYVAVTKEDSATVSATLQPFVNYPNPDVQRLALRVIAQSGDASAVGTLQSKLHEAESNLPDANAFTAQTEKQYQPVIRAYFQVLMTLSKINTSQAAQLRDQSLARFKAKYQGTDFGQKLVDAYGEASTRESQRPDKGP